MLYLRQLLRNLRQNLNETQLFTYVGTSTQPPNTIKITYAKGLPAVLFRLQQTVLTPVPGQVMYYTGLARIEFIIMADPALPDTEWYTLVHAVLETAVATDGTGSANIINESTSLADHLEYRFVVIYKVNEDLTAVAPG